MNAIQENKVSMFYKVNTFLENNATVLAVAAPGLTDLYNDFSAKLDELGTFDMQATEINTGHAAQKQLLRTNMRDLTLEVAGGLKALGYTNKDNVLIDKASITKTTIDSARDTHAYYVCLRLAELASDNAAAIIPFGVTAAKITALVGAVSEFKLAIQNPGDARSISSSAGIQVDECIEDIDELLSIMDGIMATQASSQPLLYNQYLFDRKIDDNSTDGGGTPPDVTLTIGPGQTVVAYTVPYLPSRGFKAKNNSVDPINWGLSTSETTITNPVKILSGNSTSNLLTPTLGPEGDKIVFQNTGTNPVDIELTIVE